MQAELTTPPGNLFSVLDPDYSSHSTPDSIPTSYQDHTIRTPNPFLAELEWHVAKKSFPKLEETERAVFPHAEEKEVPLPHVSNFWWRSPSQVDDLEANRSSASNLLPTARAPILPSVQTSSIPTTPPLGDTVKLPGAFPQDIARAFTARSSKKRKLNDAPPPSFLTRYRIPSPLLYHKPSRDALQNIDDEENTCICLGTSFEHFRNEDPDILDPKSNDSACGQPPPYPESEATQPLLNNQYRFVAAALPNLGTAMPSSPVEQAVLCSDPEFYTNTRPYLSQGKSIAKSKIGTGNSTPSTERSISSLAKTKKLTTHIYAVEDLRLTDTPLPRHGTSLPPASILEQSPAPQQSRTVFRSRESIFSQLPASAVCRSKSLDRYPERAIKLWSKKEDAKQDGKVDSVTFNNDTSSYIQDSRTKFQKLWDAYEKAVLGPKNAESASSKQLCLLSERRLPSPDRNKLPIVGLPGPKKGSALFPAPINPPKSAPINLKFPKETDISAPSLSTSTALIPAWLYEKQYLGLTRRRNSDIWNLEQRPLPTSNAIVKQIREARSQRKIQQAVNWVTEVVSPDMMFHDEPEDDGAYLPWLQAGWDGCLFYPEAAASDVPLPHSSPFEVVELGEEGYLTHNEPWSGTQVNDEACEEVWCDWDDDTSGWSEPSEYEFFEFEL